MTLTELMDALEAIAEATEWPEELDAPGLHRWWEEGMRFPALWHWLVPGSVEKPDNCTVRDRIRITVSIGTRPAKNTDEDARNLEAYATAYLAAIDAALYSAGGPLSGRRLGIGMASENTGAGAVLVFEIPLELQLDRTIPTT